MEGADVGICDKKVAHKQPSNSTSVDAGGVVKQPTTKFSAVESPTTLAAVVGHRLNHRAIS